MIAPNIFICPLSIEVMKDPVILVESSTLHNFERSFIEKWLEKNSSCPITREPLKTKALQPNRALKSTIDSFMQERPDLHIQQLKRILEKREEESGKQQKIIDDLKIENGLLNKRVSNERAALLRSVEETQQLKRMLEKREEESGKQKTIDELKKVNSTLNQRVITEVEALHRSKEETQQQKKIADELRRENSKLNQKNIEGAELVNALKRERNQMQALLDKLIPENQDLKEKRTKVALNSQDENRESPAEPRRAARAAGLFSNRAEGSRLNIKIIPQGLKCIVQKLGLPFAYEKEGLSFGGVSLIFENERQGQAFKTELIKVSENSGFPIALHYSSWKSFGDLQNNDRFFDLVLPNSDTYFMSMKNPELSGQLTMDVFEKFVDVSDIQKKVYSLQNQTFIDIKTNPNFPKIKPKGLECIALMLDSFMGSKRGLSFSGVYLIFKNPESASLFRIQLKELSKGMEKDAVLSSLYSAARAIGEYQNNDTIVDLNPFLNSKFYWLLNENMHISGLMLLHAFEQFFDVSGIKKAIYNTMDYQWVNREAESPSPEPLRHNL